MPHLAPLATHLPGDMRFSEVVAGLAARFSGKETAKRRFDTPVMGQSGGLWGMVAEVFG